jgi:hypothetical protein
VHFQLSKAQMTIDQLMELDNDMKKNNRRILQSITDMKPIAP